MRRLLLWVASLMIATSLLLIGVRIHNNTAACVQLLAPDTGTILTVDLNSGQAQFDPLTTYPFPVRLHDAPMNLPLSPDQRYVAESIESPETGPWGFNLRLGVRSTASRHTIPTDYPIDRFVWSPTSAQFAYLEIYGTYGTASGKLVITDPQGSLISTEIIPTSMDDTWYKSVHYPMWSPDGTIMALPLMSSKNGGSLLLRPLAAPAIYLPFPDQVVSHADWSPTSAYVLLLGIDTNFNASLAYLVSRDGNSIMPLPLASGFTPTDESDRSIVPQSWSPDGQYFILANQRQAYIFGLNGQPITSPLRVNRYFWSNLPHTLLYTTPHGEQQSLMTLDAATGQTTTLIDDVPAFDSPEIAPDGSSFVIIAQVAPNQYILHRISLDLSQQTTPFGTLESTSRLYPDWSPTQHKLMLIAKQVTSYAVLWLSDDDGQFQHYQITKQGMHNEELYGSWLTDDLIELHYTDGDKRSAWLLNTRSSHLVKLLDEDSIYEVFWHDDNYITLSTVQGFSIYRLSDGQKRFSAIPPVDYMRPIASPNGDALLFTQVNLNDEMSDSLFLATNQSVINLSAALLMTQPAWSPDGSMFAFVAIQDGKPGWRLKVLSRAGTRLKDYAVDGAIGYHSYQQVRWTNCD